MRRDMLCGNRTFSIAKYDNSRRAGGAATQTDSAGSCCEGGVSVTPGWDFAMLVDLKLCEMLDGKPVTKITIQILSPQQLLLLQKLQVPLLVLTDNGVRRDDM